VKVLDDDDVMMRLAVGFEDRVYHRSCMMMMRSDYPTDEPREKMKRDIGTEIMMTEST
jgi:hypothetical protein